MPAGGSGHTKTGSVLQQEHQRSAGTRRAARKLRGSPSAASDVASPPPGAGDSQRCTKGLSNRAGLALGARASAMGREGKIDVASECCRLGWKQLGDRFKTYPLLDPCERGKNKRLLRLDEYFFHLMLLPSSQPHSEAIQHTVI